VHRFDAFLFIIGRNEIVDALRKEVTHIKIDGEQDILASDLLLPDGAFHLKVSEELLYKAIELLPPQQRTIFKMSRQEGLNHSEIARRLGLKQPTVKNHICRSLNFLRSYLSIHTEITLSLLCGIVYWLYCWS
jgi:RNA polymerase sigma-70 factor (ECF subfamily)